MSRCSGTEGFCSILVLVSRLSYKILFIILLFLLIPIVFLFRINQKPSSVSATWWNNSWNYRVAINIGNSQSPQTNIQIKILNNYDLSTLITAGKIQASLNDLRFTDINGELISYWIEDSTNNSVDIWGIISSLPSGNSTIYLYYGNPSASDVSSSSNMTIGGTMAFIDGYRIHTFKDNGTLTNTTSTNVEILVVAGGGGGAAMTGGGGGAGGLIYNSSYAVAAQDYSVTVGLGGSGQVGTANPGNGSDGQNSSFNTLIAIGGGGAGTNSGVGRSGGSGGGAGHNNTTGGVGTSEQGNNGSGGTTAAPNYGAGGGGGAGAAGGTPTNYAGGNGGVGLAYSISGTSEYYAGGGGGGTYMGGTSGLGGTGGGGNAPAENAIPNTGGGGGGQINNQPNAGNGGSGIVILRYLSAITNSPAVEELRPQGGINIGGTSIETPPGNLVAYYKFDEGYGSVANNFGTGGSSLNGTLAPGTSSPTWTTGKVGKSLSFDGNDYVSGTLSPLKSFTVSGWIKPTGLGTDSYQNIFGWDNTNYNLIYYRPATNTIEIWNNADGNRTGIGVSANQWNHFTYVREGDSITNGRKTYINGLLVDQANSSVWTLPTSVFNIGRDPNANWHYQGQIDEVKIYDYALSKDEIKKDYNQGSAVVFGVTNLTVGNTSYSATYCVPGDPSPCASPVAEWKFEEGIGTTAYDTSGSGNNGIFGTGSSAPTWTSPGKIGKGLKFDGSDDIVSISPNSSFAFGTGNFTVSQWVYVTQQGDVQDYAGLVSHYLAAASSWFTELKNSANYNYGFYDGSAHIDSGVTIIYGQWAYFAVVRRGTGTNQAEMYVNGALVKQWTNAFNYTSTSNKLWFGNINFDAYPTQYRFKGKIDQVKIYNYARTPAQIAWDYNQGAPIAWWKMDECQGNIIHDSSGIGNTGVISIGASGTQNTLGTCQVGTSAAWTNGATSKINSSLNLDGNDDFILISSISNPQNLITLSAWIKTGGGFSYGGIVGNNYTNIRLCKDHDRTTGNEYSFDWNGQWNVGLGIPESLVEDNTWHLLTGVYDGSFIKIYLDGKEYDNHSYTGSIASPYNGLVIGRNYYSVNNYYYKGLIDDVRVYNYALTAEQIKQLYNGGAINFN